MKISKTALTVGIVLMVMGNLFAEGISLNAARVGGKDVAALAKFYQDAFGLKEVTRFEVPGMLEIMMNFGNTVAEAKANRAAQIVIMPKSDTDGNDSVSHIVLNVTDIKAVVAAVKTAGGTIAREPASFGDTGMIFGFVVDPAGNQIELIQSAKP